MATAVDMGMQLGRRTWHWLRDEDQRLRRNAALALGVLLLLPSDGLGLYVCPFHLLTGHICPACGLTRSISSLLHGEFVMSVLYHPLGALVAAYLLLLILFNKNALVAVPSATRKRVTPFLIAAVVILVLGTWVLRLIHTPQILGGVDGV